MNHFPIFLNLRDRPVLIVGGGKVGLRKLAKLHAAKAIITVVDPAARPENLPAGIVWEVAEFRSDHLKVNGLVFACALPEVNRQVVSACRQFGIWVNAASDPQDGDFMLPATFQRGHLQVAISTGGASPAQAKRIREKLENLFDEAFEGEIRDK